MPGHSRSRAGRFAPDTITEDTIADAAALPARPTGPRVRVGVAKARKAGSRPSQQRTGASKSAGSARQRAAQSNDLISDLLGHGLSWALLVAGSRTPAPLQQAEALALGRPIARLIRRNLIPQSIIAIDMPSEDKKDLALVAATIGRYIARIIHQTQARALGELQRYQQQAQAADARAPGAQEDMMAAFAAMMANEPTAEAPTPTSEASAPADHDDNADTSADDIADLEPFDINDLDVPLPGPGQHAPGFAPDAATGQPLVNQRPAGGPPGAIPGAFAAMMRSGALPGYNGAGGEE